jgi:hypothetical protein
MKTVKWDLPFNNLAYLESLTGELANHPNVLLITALHNSDEDVEYCKIHFQKSEHMSIAEAILDVGVTIGMHQVGYTEKMLAREELTRTIESIMEAIVGELEEEEDVPEEGPGPIPMSPDVEDEPSVCNSIEEEFIQESEPETDNEEDEVEEDPFEGLFTELQKEEEVATEFIDEEIQQQPKKKDTQVIRLLRVFLVRFKK